jgi:hypothetical protein
MAIRFRAKRSKPKRFGFRRKHWLYPKRVNLEREEVRGIFALGVLGSLLGVWTALQHFQVSSHISLLTLALGLIIYWGLYVFLMAIGVSNDFINRSFADFCVRVAQAYFVVGISITVVLPPVAFLIDSLQLFTWPFWELTAITYPPTIALVAYLTYRIRKRPKSWLAS